MTASGWHRICCCEESTAPLDCDIGGTILATVTGVVNCSGSACRTSGAGKWYLHDYNFWDGNMNGAHTLTFVSEVIDGGETLCYYYGTLGEKTYNIKKYTDSTCGTYESTASNNVAVEIRCWINKSTSNIRCFTIEACFSSGIVNVAEGVSIANVHETGCPQTIQSIALCEKVTDEGAGLFGDFWTDGDVVITW